MSDPLGSGGDHHQLDDDEDDKHNHADHDVSTDHHVSECGNDLPGTNGRSVDGIFQVSVQQYHAGRRNVESEFEQGEAEKHGWKDRKLEGFLDVKYGEDDDHRHGDVDDEEDVEKRTG